MFASKDIASPVFSYFYEFASSVFGEQTCKWVSCMGSLIQAGLIATSDADPFLERLNTVFPRGTQSFSEGELL